MTADGTTRIEVTLPAPVPEVQAWFEDRARVRRWFGWEAPGLDEEIDVVFGDQLVEDEDARTIQIGGHLFTFTEAASDTTSDGDRGDHRTLVTVEHRAPTADRGGARAWDADLAELDEGWLTFLHQLRFALAHHRDDPRRTIYLSGEAVADPPLPARDLLGLGPAVVGRGGEAYRAEVDPGQVLTEHVWFASEHQIGVVVDGWGPGLLVVAQAPGAVPRYLAASATLTTYGLAGDEVESLADRWATWWGSHFAPPTPRPARSDR